MKISVFKIRPFIIAIVLSCTIFSSAIAQEYTGISAHIGGVAPVGSFSHKNFNTIDNNILLNGATFGCSFGLKFSYYFQDTQWEDYGMGVFLSADFIWNTVCKDYKTFNANYFVTNINYFNLPVILGVSYTYDLGSRDIVSLFSQVGVGIDFFKRSQDISIDNNVYKYDFVYNFAAEIGIGVIFVDQYSIGLHYNFLGNQKIRFQGVAYEGDNNSGNNNNNNVENDNNSSAVDYSAKMSMNIFCIKLGYHF